MVLGLRRGRRGLFVVVVVVVGAKDVPGVIDSISSTVFGVSGLGVVLCLEGFGILGRGRRVLGCCDIFGATVVQGVSVLIVTASMSVAGTMVMAGVSVSTVTGLKAGLIEGTSGFAVIWGLGSNCFGGFESTVGTKSSGCTVAGSRAGLDLGTSGLGVVLGRGRRPGRLVFLEANVVVVGLVPSIPGSETIVDCDGVGA